MSERPPSQSPILVSRNWQESGPYTLEQLRQKILKGEVLLDSWFWQEGMTRWEPLATLFPGIDEERRLAAQPIITIEVGDKKKKTSKLSSNQLQEALTKHHF